MLPGARVTSGDSVRGRGVTSVANAFFDAGAQSVITSLAPHESDSEIYDDLRLRLAADPSVMTAVTEVQRDALRRNGRRLGAWSRIVVYGAGR
jgi:hypothetical protein